MIEIELDGRKWRVFLAQSGVTVSSVGVDTLRDPSEEALVKIGLLAPLLVPMIIHCPACGERHIDEGEFATKPHHTHACQSCGVVWRPAIVATVGVQFLPGFKNP